MNSKLTIPLLVLLTACATGRTARVAEMESLRLAVEGEVGTTTRAPTGREGGNGGPRGGGDRVAGEFMEYERIALGRMECWKAAGKLELSDADLEKIRKLMPPNERTDPKHVVSSEPHVCLTEPKPGRPSKLANGECAIAADERDVVKQPCAAPPRLFVGRVRWDEPGNTPIQKEAVAGHELRGLALTKCVKRPNGEIDVESFADEDFEHTFVALASATKEWNAIVHQHLDAIRRIRLLDEMNDLVDLKHFETVKETFTASSADYLRCVNASDAEVAEIGKIQDKVIKKVEKRKNRKNPGTGLFGGLREIESAARELNRSDVKQACDRALEQFHALLIRTATPKIQEQANQIRKKVLAVVKEWEAWANTQTNPEWHAWLFRTMNAYVERRNDAFRKFNSRSPSQSEIGEIMNPILDRACPRKEIGGDFRKAVTCNVDAGVPAVNAYFKTFLSRNVDDLIEAHERTIDEIAARIDPSCRRE